MKNGLELAVTTIGDILVENKLSRDEQGKSVDNVNLKIPNYQRPYKWTVKNANQLLDDIIEAQQQNKEVYRVGTLILNKNEEGSFDIVDGQQRTITFSLLLKTLEVSNIQLLDEDIPNNEYYLKNIYNNYLTFKRRLDKYDEKEKKNLLTYIEQNCELIVVITSDLTEAFQFFDSQNARGKKLYPHDLLKAYHLREMNNVETVEIEKTVKTWEDMNQKDLSALFNDYLYRIKEWIKGNRAYELDEKNIGMFKGINGEDNYPYAQYYKGAFAFASDVNKSPIPFVTGTHKLRSFQLDTPIVAGQPFFDYAKHYFDILADIQNNDKYEGYFINDNPIIATLNQRKYRNGVGNRIARLLLDTSILLYVDRFCPDKPNKNDLALLDQFVIFAFIWAYSLRAQYTNLGWLSAQNYILGESDIQNSFNMFKEIVDADSPNTLLTSLSDLIKPLSPTQIPFKYNEGLEEQDGGIRCSYFYYFVKYNFLEENTNEK